MSLLPYQAEGSLMALSRPASPVLGGRSTGITPGSIATGAKAARTTGVGVLLRVPLKMPCGTCWKTCGTNAGTNGTGTAVGIGVGATVGAATAMLATAAAPTPNSFVVRGPVVFTSGPGSVARTVTVI